MRVHAPAATPAAARTGTKVTAPPAPARKEVRRILSSPDDNAEREADRVADRVMRMCADCKEEVGEVQAKTAPGTTARVPDGFDAGLQALQGGGRPLSSSERDFFEPRFARDLAGVRLHTGPAAEALTRSVQARAFTLGSSIVLGAGQYAPETDGGRRLLAHELTHVVQQGGDGGVVQRAVDFTAAFSNISLTDGDKATIEDGEFQYHDADFSADIEFTATGDTEAELKEWDVGVLQDLVTNWDRYYWRRSNADGRGQYLEKKYTPVTGTFRDQASDAKTIWTDDSEHQLLNALEAKPAGARFRVSTTITTSDFPGGPDEVSGSTQNGADASDGNRNIEIQRTGARFNTWASAHNIVTDDWRHLKFLNWNYQRSLDFSGSGATLDVGKESRLLGKHGPHDAGKDAPLTSGTTANEVSSDPAHYPVRRVNGWT
jgi:hypothetical protein